jgi:hypothetical protein
MLFKRRTGAISGVILSLVGCLASTVWLGGQAIPAEAAKSGAMGTKIVDMIEVQRVWDAVRITKVSVDGQQIETGLSGPRGEYRQGTPFQADEGWLKNMTITLINRTDKPIVYAQIMLWFPDTMNANPDKATTSYRVIVGQRPESSLFYKDGSKIPPDTTKKPLLLAPGETLVISLAADAEAIQSTIEGGGNTSFSNITRLNIEPRDFYFADGMRWSIGSYYTPDASHPGKYIKLDDTYFPGSRATTQTLK